MADRPAGNGAEARPCQPGLPGCPERACPGRRHCDGMGRHGAADPAVSCTAAEARYEGRIVLAGQVLRRSRSAAVCRPRRWPNRRAQLPMSSVQSSMASASQAMARAIGGSLAGQGSPRCPLRGWRFLPWWQSLPGADNC